MFPGGLLHSSLYSSRHPPNCWLSTYDCDQVLLLSFIHAHIFTQTARFLPPPLEDLDKPGEEESSDAEDELLENGRWKERRMEEKVEEAEKMLGGKRSSMTG